jgi:pseudouridine-5'-phosphate glycosidase
MLEVRPEVAAALADGLPVVALESAFLTHGLPAPRHLEVARSMLSAVRAEGAVPAMVAVDEGRLIVGLEPERMTALATSRRVAKVSRRDLGPVLADGRPGGTTVSATLTAVGLAGIPIMATGGIGGAHRGVPAGEDISADLPQIARTRAAVVCSGAKAVLDLPRTLELLETLGVPVLGYGTDELPAFYSARGELPLAHRVDDPAAAAGVLSAHWRVESTGVVIAVPPPAECDLAVDQVQPVIEEALRAAHATGIRGAATTPFLLARLAEATGGQTVETNAALLAHNASVAARIASALA